MTVTNDWHNTLATNCQATALFFDIRKAFDCVPYLHILTSLSSLGVSSPLLAWFSNYLTNRQQKLSLMESPPLSLTFGVPQGSILGPLHFICFMNSISSLPLSPGSKLVLYADDIILYQTTDSTQDTDFLQCDIQCDMLINVFVYYSFYFWESPLTSIHLLFAICCLVLTLKKNWTKNHWFIRRYRR